MDSVLIATMVVSVAVVFYIFGKFDGERSVRLKWKKAEDRRLEYLLKLAEEDAKSVQEIMERVEGRVSE